jgi:hypothetical protein
MRQIDAHWLGNLVRVVVNLDNSRSRSQFVAEENPISGDREGFFRTSFHVDLDYLPAFSSAVNKGALLGDRLVTIHVEIALFSGWIAVVPKYYLLRRSHGLLLLLIPPPDWSVVSVG